MTPVYVAYYRVSTDRQAESGLGLEAQRSSVARFIKTSGALIAEFTEIESGKRHMNRPKLLAALEECRKRSAVLIVAKLDRLARNVAFISALMESGVEFLAVDMPTANKLTIHIMAAMAEHEREMISTRTKAALAALKARGVVLGSPTLADARARAVIAHRAQQPDAVVKLVEDSRRQGMSLRAIAARLNGLNVPTIQRASGNTRCAGKKWHGSTVRNLLALTASPIRP